MIETMTKLTQYVLKHSVEGLNDFVKEKPRHFGCAQSFQKIHPSAWRKEIILNG